MTPLEPPQLVSFSVGSSSLFVPKGEPRNPGEEAHSPHSEFVSVDVGKNADRQLCFQTTLSSSQHTVNDLEATIVRSIHFLAVSNILWIKPL